MNRLWVRLTLAFVAVTLVGVGVVALLTDWTAGTQFRQYVARQQNLTDAGLLNDLAGHYATQGSWDGVAAVFSRYLATLGRGQGGGQGAMRGRPGLVLADANGLIVYDERGTRAGSAATTDEKAASVPVVVDRRTVGYLVAIGGAGRVTMAPAEQTFLDDLRNSLLVAALLAGLVSILMGLAMSFLLTKPLARLAQAARAFAARDWSRRVPVEGNTEIAGVAREFNAMAQTIQDAETLRSNLMADVAHELRTPLTVLTGNLRAMLDGVYPLELKEIACLYDETRVLNRLVDDLRELALAEAGQLRLTPQTIDAAADARAVVAGFAAVAQVQEIQLRVEGDERVPVVADPDRLAQVLRNLIANAIRHTPAGGQVTVTTRADTPDLARIIVSDTGEGIAAAELPHVFDRFYRGDKSRARSSGGTGLGLAIAKAWVEAMGGTIGVESVQGHGSRFWVTVPRATQLSAPPSGEEG